MSENRIWHLVAIKLKQEKGSPEAQSFMAEGRAALEDIDGVEQFESLEQIFGQTGLDYCYSMEFADQTAYDRYFSAQTHMEFGGRRWHEVTKHLKIDLQPVEEIGKERHLSGKQIRHMVIFCLKHEKGSPEAESFMAEGKAILEKIAGVKRFEALKQICGETEYDYCFSMEFADQAAYDSYSNDPVHNDFVNRRWKPEVAKAVVVDLRPAN